MLNEEESKESLTLVQASCLVLGLVPSKKDRVKAKEMIENTKICEVTYKRTGDPFEPALTSKRLKQLNPFLYKSYNETPPSSPNSTDEEEINLITQPTENDGKDVVRTKNKVRLIKKTPN
ncbi:hypothetical protein INT47_002950 [Mucor saturninus]|uniref:Uncharacterized protein n=1 Tax=Mucor saturninus TaxID=64648 RepID=A0A8H7UVU1_9FUNG|nr:hypothetical protein INT47_002950 [Mucor saturninus]